MLAKYVDTSEASPCLKSMSDKTIVAGYRNFSLFSSIIVEADS